MIEASAIYTWYNGQFFRSRLEARWAVFFDCLGVAYEYEPEGYHLGDGIFYLPDFRIRVKDEGDVFVEVKGKMTPKDAMKIRRLAEQAPVLVVGNIPAAGHGHDSALCTDMDGTGIHRFSMISGDAEYLNAFPCMDNNEFRLGRCGDKDIIELAYTQARIARFEYGDTPDPEELREIMARLTAEKKRRRWPWSC